MKKSILLAFMFIFILLCACDADHTVITQEEAVGIALEEIPGILENENVSDVQYNDGRVVFENAADGYRLELNVFLTIEGEDYTQSFFFIMDEKGAVEEHGIGQDRMPAQ
ncbi:MAG: hypothetical protein ACOX88_00300 [Christensenellales bacterium]|jgi:hypothetical protein